MYVEEIQIKKDRWAGNEAYRMNTGKEYKILF
jgi:hypothetical protein